MRPHRCYFEEEKKVLLATVERGHEQSAQPLSWILAERGLTRSVYCDWLDRGKKGSLTDRVVVSWSPLAVVPEEIEAPTAYVKDHFREG